METIKTYSPEKEPGRLNYVYLLALTILVATFLSISGLRKHSNRNPNSPASSGATFLCIVGLGSFWVLSRKLTTHIELDVEKKSLTIHYLTAWKTYNQKIFLLDTLMYTFTSSASRHSQKKWTLAFKQPGTRAFHIESGQFSKETLDRLVEDLNALKKKYV